MKNQLRDRWRTPEGALLTQEVFRAFLAGEDFHGLNLGEHEGRVDLRGLAAPEVRKLPPGTSIHLLEGQLVFKSIRFENLDLSGARLNHFRFFNSTISNCRIDEAQCEDWRLWATDVCTSTFISSNLRQAVLGAWYEGRGNNFKFVDFSKADMRDVVSPAATFTDCNFSHARLERIDFESSGFVRCHFAGELRDVIFDHHGFETGKTEPNPMEDVDFTKAKLRNVEFRRLNLDRVYLPQDGDHLIITKYPCVLRKALEALAGTNTPYELGLTGLLENKLKWLGSKQEIGVLNRLDFSELWGSQGEEFAVKLLHSMENLCQNSPHQG